MTSHYEKQIEGAKECVMLSSVIWWTGFLLLPDGHHQKHSSFLLKLSCSHLLAFWLLLVYTDKTKRIWTICGKVILYHLYVQLYLLTSSKWCLDLLDLTTKTPAQNARKQIRPHQYETYGVCWIEIWKKPASLMNASPSMNNYFHLVAILNLHSSYHLNLLKMTLRCLGLRYIKRIPTARSDLLWKTNRWSPTRKRWRANSSEPGQFV